MFLRDLEGLGTDTHYKVLTMEASKHSKPMGCWN